MMRVMIGSVNTVTERAVNGMTANREKRKAGSLKHRDEDRPVKPEEIESAPGDLRKLTDDGIVGRDGGGG